MPFLCQDHGINILVIGFPQTSGQTNRKTRGHKFLQQQEELLHTLSMLPGMCVCRIHGSSTSLCSKCHCVGLITNCTIPNSSRILTGSPSAQLGKDSLSPMERAVSCVFHDCCNSNAVLEIGDYLNDEHICFASRKGAHGFGHSS